MIDWTAFLPAAALVSLVPGANQLLSLRNAIRYGTTPATVALVGRFTAFGLMAVAVSLGLGAVLTGSAVAFEIVKWVGVAYLTYLGVVTLWRAKRCSPRLENAERTLDTTSFCQRVWCAMRQEFLVAITNPKAMLLFAAFLPQFLPHGQAADVSLLPLAACYIGIEAISAIGYTLLGGRLGAVDFTARAHRRLDAITGASFLGLGGYLAIEQHP